MVFYHSSRKVIETFLPSYSMVSSAMLYQKMALNRYTLMPDSKQYLLGPQTIRNKILSYFVVLRVEPRASDMLEKTTLVI